MSRQVAKLNQRVRAGAKVRVSKRRLLPLPRHEIDAMALQYHFALAALRAQQGTEHGLRILLQMVILTGFIGDARAEKIDRVVLHQMDRDLVAAVDRGHETGVWYLDAPVADVCAALVTHHERQLSTASLMVLDEAIARLGRLKRGESYGSSRT